MKHLINHSMKIILFSLCFFSKETMATSFMMDDLLDMSMNELSNIKITTASKRQQKLFQSPSAISVITKNDILRSPAHNIPELLQYVVGMDGYTKTYTDMDVAARGTASDETQKMLVLIDGQPVNVVPYGGVQWPTLPITLDDIEKIEVLRGPGSSVYGADALVGIIHIITKAVKNRENMVSLLYGERGTTHNALRFTTQVTDNLEFGATLSYVRTEKTDDKESNEATLAAPNWEIKDWANIADTNFRLDYHSPSLIISSTGGFSTDEEGYNPSPGDHSIDKSEKDTFFLNNKISHHFTNRDDLLLRLGYRGLRQENKKYTSANEYAFKYKLRKGDGLDIDLQYNVNRFENHAVILGYNHNYLNAGREISNPSGLYIYDSTDILHAFYVQDQFHILNDAVQLTLGGRYDNWDDFNAVFTPRAAANIFLNEETLTLRLATSTSFRRPSFDEILYFVEFGPPNTGWFKGGAITQTTNNSGKVIEGKSLKPEKLRAYELGLRWQPNDNHMINVEYYYNEITDILELIVYDLVPPGIPNLGVANTDTKNIFQGIELEVKNQYSDSLSSFINYTYQWGIDGSGNDLNNLPKNKFNAGISYLGAVNIDARIRHVSGVTFSEVPTTPVEKYTTMDLAVSKALNNRFFLKLSVMNLLNDKHYEYPLYTKITRKTMLTLKYSF